MENIMFASDRLEQVSSLISIPHWVSMDLLSYSSTLQRYKKQYFIHLRYIIIKECFKPSNHFGKLSVRLS